MKSQNVEIIAMLEQELANYSRDLRKQILRQYFFRYLFMFVALFAIMGGTFVYSDSRPEWA